MKKYKLKYDRFEHTVGTIVQDYNGFDYGLSHDDSRVTGIEHTSVSLDGELPFFTIPVEDLDEI